VHVRNCAVTFYVRLPSVSFYPFSCTFYLVCKLCCALNRDEMKFNTPKDKKKLDCIFWLTSW
jgi:hypothetical protein